MSLQRKCWRLKNKLMNSEETCSVCDNPATETMGTCACLPSHGSWHLECDPHAACADECESQAQIIADFCKDKTVISDFLCEGCGNKTPVACCVKCDPIAKVKQAKKEILQELLKKTENGGFAPLQLYGGVASAGNGGAIANSAVRQWAESKL